MATAVQDRRVTAEQVARHQDLERDLPAVRRSLEAFDRSFLEDVEAARRFAFAEDELVFPVTGLH